MKTMAPLSGSPTLIAYDSKPAVKESNVSQSASSLHNKNCELVGKEINAESIKSLPDALLAALNDEKADGIIKYMADNNLETLSLVTLDQNTAIQVSTFTYQGMSAGVTIEQSIPEGSRKIENLDHHNGSDYFNHQLRAEITGGNLKQLV